MTTFADTVRVATGLQTTWQSIAWLGTEAGFFARRGIDTAFPALGVGGPAATAGLTRGDWELAHTGALPVAEAVLRGLDAVIVATPTCQFAATFVMTPPGMADLAGLDGRRVGVITHAGQTSVAARLAIEAAGAAAVYVPLHSFAGIYAALAAGEIQAGALPIDMRDRGEAEHGWIAFPLHEFGTPSVLATTRRFLASRRDVAIRVMQAVVETIHAFKTRPEVVVPRLQRYLGIADRAAAERLHALHVPLFREAPRPLLDGLPALRDHLSRTYPQAGALRADDIADPSLIDALEQDGFIARLYARPAERG